MSVFCRKFQDIGAKAKDFNNLSGKYTMDLIIGDAVIENPISWTVVSVVETLVLIVVFAFYRQDNRIVLMIYRLIIYIRGVSVPGRPDTPGSKYRHTWK